MSRHPSRLSRAWPVALFGLAAALLPALPASAQEAPFYGEADIRPGDEITSQFTGPGGVHQYSFFAPIGSVVTANLAPASGSALRPTMRLLRPGGYQVVTGNALRKNGAKTVLQKFRLPYSGWFVLEIGPGTAGAGAYRLTTSGKLAKKYDGLVPGAAPDTPTSDFREFDFHGVQGAKVTIQAMPRGQSRAKPQIESVRAVDGTVVWPLPGQPTAPAKAEDVSLPQSARYTIRWKNVGSKGDVKFRFQTVNPQTTNFTYALPASSGTSPYIADQGDPALDPLPGYVGSGACGRCHDDIYRGWARTVHNLAARTWDRPGLTGRAFVNDVNRNGKSDFEDGLDLATQPAFASYGANAPKLLYATGAAFPFQMRIGAVTYEVVRLMGGNGQWKQRYLLRAGEHIYPSPVQFNDVSGQYATYDAGDWYSGTAPKWADPAQIPHAQSFEARCSGCHNTGLDLQYTGGVTGDFRTGHTDYNIGCEQCHGPGDEHVKKQGEQGTIQNPRDLHDGTAEGVANSDAVCGRCHTRGTARDAYPGVTEAAFQKAGFGWTVAGGVPKYGDTLRDYFDVTTKSSDYWGQTPRILYTDPDPAKTEYDDFSWVASKSHRQQSLDKETGAHAPHAGYVPGCIDCHDPHFRTRKHQVRTSVPLVPERGGEDPTLPAVPPFPTRTEDNTLCLACHARHGSFVRIPLEDVAKIASGEVTFAVKDGVIEHMRDIGMPTSYEAFDPTGTHVGQCVSCHAPLVEKTALNFTDMAGFTGGGDEHSHRFETINPRVSHALSSPGTRNGPTNSCNVCHPTGPSDIVGPIIEQWAVDTSDADSGFHADRPRSFQNGKANPNRDGGLWCVQCHTTEGFIKIQVNGDRIDQSESNDILRHAYERMKGIACDACHGKQGDGTFAEGRNPLRMPSDVLCGSCHNNQSVVFEDFRQYGELVKHPTREMLIGTAGAEVSGTYGNSVHTDLEDACVTCHFNKEAGGETHSFQPQITACQQCHPSLTTFDRPSNSDWDGNGQKQGIQTEITGLLNILQTTLVGTSGGQITFSGSYFEYGGATDHKMTGASDPQKRAAFNWYSVSYDASRGVHNAVRSVQLLQRSIKELDPAAIPGAALR